MPLLDARTRLAQRIRRLLEDRGLTNRALATHLGHKDAWASHLLAGRFALSLDEIDAVAAFLGVPASDLVRHSYDPWELDAQEMRVVRAVRMLPPIVREHLVTLADYLVGATPEEVELLHGIRTLQPADQRVLEQWIRVRLRLRGDELIGLDPDAPAGTDETPTAATPRIRPVLMRKRARRTPPPK